MGRIWDLLNGNLEKREEELRQFAFEHNLDFSNKNDKGLISQLNSFDLFKVGGRKKILSSAHKRNLTDNHYILDFEYIVSTGNASARYSQTVRVFDSKELGIPQFKMYPENFFHLIKEWFVSKDIDFSSDEDFSNLFYLTGEYEEVIKTYFDDEVRQLCLNNKKFRMEGNNYYLILYIHNEIIKLKDLSAFYKLSNMIFELFRIRSLIHKI